MGGNFCKTKPQIPTITAFQPLFCLVRVLGRIVQCYTLRPIPSRDSLGEKHWYQQHVPTISGKQLLRKNDI